MEEKIIGFIRSLEDVTGLKTVEEDLRKANEELQLRAGRLEHEVKERTAKLQEALAELDILSYNIVHNMRGPLRAMIGFANILLQDYSSRLDAQGQEFLKRIAGAADKQDCLIQDVLSYHNYVRNEFPLAPLDMDQLVDDVLNTHAYFRTEKSHILIRRPLGWLLANETLIRQCAVALLDNAIKFSVQGVRPEIGIGSEKTSTHVTLWIQDNGIGIAPEYHAKIFDLFQTLHTLEAYPGNGIGLPLAKKAVEKMKGRIGVESEVGKGARFWITLKTVESF